MVCKAASASPVGPNPLTHTRSASISPRRWPWKRGALRSRRSPRPPPASPRRATSRPPWTCSPGRRARPSPDAVVVRIAGSDDRLEAVAFAPAGSPLGAELAGTRSDPETALRGTVPQATRRAATRLGARALLAVPARVDGRVVASLEAIRTGLEFEDRK